MKIRLLTYFFNCLLIVTSLKAQSTVKLYGTVVDRLTNRPLIGANILIEGTGIGAATNQNGYFEIENVLEGVYNLTAQHIGYKSQRQVDIRIPKDRAIQLSFRLKLCAIPLAAIEISAERFNERESVNLHVISKEAISRTNASTVGELIAQVPGVDVQESGGMGGSIKISIRGSQTNQVLVLVDGVPLNNTLGGDADLATIPPNIVERIEIHKGGMSSKFGNGAIGGVVNIITKKALQSEIKINSTAGSFETYSMEPTISGNYGKLGYIFTYQYLSSDGSFPYEYVDSRNQLITKNRRNADILSRSIFGRFNLTHRSHSFSMHAKQLHSDRGLPGKIDGWTPFARTDNTQKSLGFDYKFIQPTFELSSSINFSDAQTKNINLYPDDVELRYKRYPQYNYRYSIKNIITNAQIRYIPNSWYQVTTGYTLRNLEYHDKNLMPTLSSAIQQAEDNMHGVFLHQDFTMQLPWYAGRFSLAPSIRYDEMNMVSGEQKRWVQQWSPACAAMLSFGSRQKIYLKSSIARSFRAPTFADLFYQDVRVKGKPDLLPEKSLNNDITLGMQWNYWGMIGAEATHFHYEIDNLIVWRLGNFEVFSPFNNDADITGQEYMITANSASELISLEVAYAELEPLNKLDNKTTFNKILPYRPRHSLKAALSLHYNHLFMKIHINDIGERFLNEANTQMLNGYQVWDMNASWDMKVRTCMVTWKLSVLNMTDEIYTIIRDMPLPGREWRGGLSVTF